MPSAYVLLVCLCSLSAASRINMDMDMDMEQQLVVPRTRQLLSSLRRQLGQMAHAPSAQFHRPTDSRSFTWPSGTHKVLNGGPQRRKSHPTKIFEKMLDTYASTTAELRIVARDLSDKVQEGLKEAIRPVYEKASEYPLVRRMLDLIERDVHLGKKIVLGIIAFTPLDEMFIAWLCSKVIPQSIQDKIIELLMLIAQKADRYYEEHSEPITLFLKSMFEVEEWNAIRITEVDDLLTEVRSGYDEGIFEKEERDFLGDLARAYKHYFSRFESGSAWSTDTE